MHVLVVLFVATFIRSALGFGDGIVAIPLLALFIPLRVATPLVVMVSVTIAAVVVAQDWRKVHVRSTGWLVAATVAGLPVGLMLLKNGHDRGVKVGLAFLILAFAGYSLLGKRSPELTHDSGWWLLSCGFCAGILGGAYGMNGPPLVVYGAMRRWTAQHFRATLQGYFLPAGIAGLVGFWLTGLLVPAVTHYYLRSLPVLLPAIWLGRMVNHRLHGDVFLKYVYVGLAAIGVTLMVETLRR